MSRAFVKDDGPDQAPIIPPRPPLPAGVTNYVTPRGLSLLKAERTRLEKQKSSLKSESESQRSVLIQQIADLQKRISSAHVVTPPPEPPSSVRFGVTVSLMFEDERRRKLTIVGVDEADPEKDLIAFTSPIARAITGKEAGATVHLKTPIGEDIFVIDTISLPTSNPITE